ncbi:ABC transporter substrate-binding protein [Salinibacterium soli]|uniref:Sugar ABC transporter substrate-binding protein n=1 Tax=Antiquaquibacter soli TaxID=3064523 RepID=A0ABT9BTL8_9MICO|nr:sugar ABC transporter substrate-binding protein [Protaetiibacter sp. WY-16]MDO7882702.1 sugar ABC transporter substrate-binding protein [Protaetiibacter sp. WY-16]
MEVPRTFLSAQASRRGFLAGGLAAAGMGLLAACTPGGSQSKSTEIPVMMNYSAAFEKEFLRVTQGYERATGNTVDLLNIAAADQYATKLKTLALAKQLPALYYVASFDLGTHIKNGWVQDLTPYIERNEDVVQSADFFPAVVSQTSRDGKMYGLSDGLSSYGMYVNKTMFDELGIPLPDDDNWTWDDYFDLTEAFKLTDGGRQTRWGGLANHGSWAFRGIFSANGGQVFSDDLSECIIANDENIATVEQLRAAAKRGSVPDPGGLPSGVDPFASGILAMVMDGSWYVQGARDSIGDKFEWDVLKLPKGSTGRRDVAVATGTYVMSRDTENTETAFDFLSYYTSATIQDSIPFLQLGTVQPRVQQEKDYQERSKLEDLPPANRLNVFPWQIQNDAGDLPYPDYWTAFETVWFNRLISLFTGPDSAKTVLEQIQEETNRQR